MSSEEPKYKLMTKAEFAEKLGISNSCRAKWLNSLYYEELKKLGYRKTQRFLLPKQLEFLFKTLCYVETED